MKPHPEPESYNQYHNKHTVKPADEPCGLDPMMSAMGYTRTEENGNIKYTLAEADKITRPKFELGEEVFYTELNTSKHSAPEFCIWKCRVVWINWGGESYEYALVNLFDGERIDGLPDEWQIHETQDDAVSYAIGYIREYYSDK